jgi:hypothetical protein
MKYKLLWSGLADENYYNVIAKYCIPSWKILPGDKHLICDINLITIPEIAHTTIDSVLNKDSNYLKRKPNKKPWNFWRKMQSQVWTAKNFKDKYDFIILLDTDIEIFSTFSVEKLNEELENFLKSDYVWATGRSQSRLHDSGFIILNTNHPLYNKLIQDYEEIWESGKISELRKPYDGIAVESMFSVYPSYKILNTDYGKGLHVYDLGMVHYGSKIPKKLRATSLDPGLNIVNDYVKDIIVKEYK